MNENMTRFYEAVSADEGLQAELAAVAEGVQIEGVPEAEAKQAVAEALAAFAAAHDFDLSAEDVLAADAELSQGELSESELAAVAGGGDCICMVGGASKGSFCLLIGAGKGLSELKMCAVLFGV